jgi:hypothetical protein
MKMQILSIHVRKSVKLYFNEREGVFTENLPSI